MNLAVSESITSTILNLQQLSAFKEFYLAGGTNLSLKFNHRKSYDIDLFANKIIGRKGLDKVKEEITSFYAPKKITVNYINEDLEEQYQFLRAFIFQDGETIKVECLQNLHTVKPIEVFNKLRICSLVDLGLFKLHIAVSRGANKDIYDLDYITDEIPLPQLLKSLKTKQANFKGKQFESIFDLDAKPNIFANPNILLDITENRKNTSNRPFHSNYRVDIIKGNKTWEVARVSWRLKVKDYLRSLE